MAITGPPFSATVTSVFDAFVKRLEDHKALSVEALAALRQALDQHKLDAESLRDAIFTSAGSSSDPD